MIQSLEGMDLSDRLREMSSRVRQRVDNVKTEEATKTALVMPFINPVAGSTKNPINTVFIGVFELQT